MKLRLLAVTLALSGVSAAPAGATVFTVVNERGTPQYSLYKRSSVPEATFATSRTGQVDLDVAPGETLRFTRSTGGAPQCAPPEGEGIQYVVPDVAPATATITLPLTTGPGAAPALDDGERWVVGQINRRRAERGLGPVVASGSLNRAADAVAADAATIKATTGTFPFPPKHCSAIPNDWGFPTFGFSTVDQKSGDPRDAWEHWSDGSIRETNGTLGDWDSVGVGSADGAYIAFFAKCPEAAPERCERAGDQGDPNLVLPPKPGTGSTPPPKVDSGPIAPSPAGRLVVQSKGAKKLPVVRATCAVSAGCRAVVSVKHGSSVLARASARFSGTKTVRLVLTKAGRRALTKRGTVRLRLSASLAASGAEAVTLARTVSLRR